MTGTLQCTDITENVTYTRSFKIKSKVIDHKTWEVTATSDNYVCSIRAILPPMLMEVFYKTSYFDSMRRAVVFRIMDFIAERAEPSEGPMWFVTEYEINEHN